MGRTSGSRKCEGSTRNCYRPHGGTAGVDQMKLFEYAVRDAKAGHCPFRDEYVEDGWTVYHGTSNHAETLIEHEGLVWSDRSYSHADCIRVLQVFNELQWFGLHKDGVPVLSTFTQSELFPGC